MILSTILTQENSFPRECMAQAGKASSGEQAYCNCPNFIERNAKMRN